MKAFPFGLVECPASVRFGNVFKGKVGKKTKFLQGHREKWAYFMNCTIRTFFIS